MGKTLNIAHRGGAGLKPENTWPLFPTPSRAAMTAPNWMCSFPPMAWWWCITIFVSIRRLTRHAGGWLTGQTPAIKDLSYAALQAVRCGPRRSGQRLCAHPLLKPVDAPVPALAEVVALAAARTGVLPLFVELKSDTSEDSADPNALADAAYEVIVAGRIFSLQ